MQIMTRLGRAVVFLFACAAPVLPARAQSPDSMTVGLKGSARFQSIQEAVDSADKGAVIRIAPGVYDEIVTIDKPLTLRGSGWRQSVLTSSAAETLVLKSAEPIVIEGLRISSRAPALQDARGRRAVVVLDGAAAQLQDCVVSGGPGNGILAENGSSAEIRKCLVARVGGAGVCANQGREGRVHVVDSDLRDCTYCGVLIRKGCDATAVERCRISGAKWHGVRYDHCAPQINGNVFSGNARTAIYASGKTHATVVLNLFLGQDLTCWFENQDTISSNTFVGPDTGVFVLGASRPTIRHNIFYRNAIAIRAGGIAGESGDSAVSNGTIDARENLFWQNDKDLMSKVAQDLFDAKLGNMQVDPKFVNVAKQNYELAEDSPVKRRRIGANRHIPMQSPWPADAVEPATATRTQPRKLPPEKPKPGSKSGARMDLDSLLKALKQDPDRELRHAAGSLLRRHAGRQADGRIADAFLALLDTDDDVQLRSTLSALNGLRVNEPLEKRYLELAKANAETRDLVLHLVLGSLPDKSPAVIDEILSAVNSNRRDVSSRGLHALRTGVQEGQKKRVADAVLERLRQDPHGRNWQMCVFLLRQYAADTHVRGLKEIAARDDAHEALRRSLDDVISQIGQRHKGARRD